MAFLFGTRPQNFVQQVKTTVTDRNLIQQQRDLAVYSPPSRRVTSIAEVDKQNDDNLTFVFEYRGFLNSKLSTIVTKLTNALTTDLDVAMSRNWTVGSTKPAMQGAAAVDPGAGRTTLLNIGTWTSTAGTATTGPINSTVVDDFDDAVNVSILGPSTSSYASVNYTTAATTASIGNSQGTSTLQTYTTGQAAIDALIVNFNSLADNLYATTKSTPTNVSEAYNITRYRAGNKFEETLLKESRDPRFRDILKAGLFNDLIISATSTSPTGSQTQMSITLNFERSSVSAGDGGVVPIKINRWTAFYHS